MSGLSVADSSPFLTTDRRSTDPQGHSQAPLMAIKEKEDNDDNDGAGGVGSY